MLRRLVSTQELAWASNDDALLAWIAQDGVGTSTTAWAYGSAVGVAGAGLPQGRRLAIAGSTSDVAALLRSVERETVLGYRLLGAAPLLASLTRGMRLRIVEEFWWMELGGGQLVGVDNEAARWLDEGDLDDVEVLLDVSFPASRARAGVPGVRRWAGIRERGLLVAVAADAWSCTTVGFISGVATHPAHRGRGLGRSVSRFVIQHLLNECGRAGLYADAWNRAAVALYASVGMSSHRVATADLTAVA